MTPEYVKLFFLCLIACFASLEASMPKIEELSLEAKVGQLLIVHFNGNQLNDDAKKLIKEAHVGGIIYYNWANDLESPEQAHALSRQLQTYAKAHALPLFISVDQEGGVVNRLKKCLTIFPGNRALAMANVLEWTEQCGMAMGQELRSVGVNLNFAPVIDIDAHPANPINIRSFSSCAQEVISHAERLLKGYHQTGLMAALKHFPGHGHATKDSHEALPTIELSLKELEQDALLPFTRLSDQADMIMTGHLSVPAWDENHCVTFSYPIVTGWLRHHLRYQGVVITDSLVMQGILDQEDDIRKVALKSLLAGHDLLLLGGKQLQKQQQGYELTADDVYRIHAYLVQAVKEGIIKEERINESVARILALKERYHLFDEVPYCRAIEVNRALHEELARKIAQRAIRWDRRVPDAWNKLSRILLLMPDVLKEDCANIKFPLSLQQNLSWYSPFNLQEENIQSLLEIGKQAQGIIICSYQACQDLKQERLIQQLAQLNKPIALIVLRNPQDGACFPTIPSVIQTFSPTPFAIEEAIHMLIKDGHD